MSKIISPSISPWSDSADCVSPDGKYRAIIHQASEVGMGAPTSGTLVITENSPDGRILSRHMSCSPSFVWSADSKEIAVPQWTQDRNQKLVIVTVPSGQVRVLPEDYYVLELSSFENRIVRGIDSPVYMPRQIERQLSP
jgi:hypothetical protein